MTALSRIIALFSNTRSAWSKACARERINLFLENRIICHLKLCFTIIVGVWRLLEKKCHHSNPFWKKSTFNILIGKFLFNFSKRKKFSSNYWKIWKVKKNILIFILKDVFYAVHFHRDTSLRKWAYFWMSKNFKYDYVILKKS